MAGEEFLRNIGKLILISVFLIPDIPFYIDLKSPDQILYPVLSKFGDNGVALASLQRTNSNNTFNLHVRTYNLTGEVHNVCSISSIELPDAVGKIESLELGKSSVIVSFFLHDSDTTAYLQLYVIRTEDCKWYMKEYRIDSVNTELKYVPRYSLVPGPNGTADLFAWSSSVCGGICKFSIRELNDVMDETLEVSTFIEEEPQNFWKLLPIDSHDISKGYYYIQKSRIYDGDKPEIIDTAPIEQPENINTTSRICKLDENGVILKCIETKFYFNPWTSFSNAYNNLGICGFTDLYNFTISCILFDSSLNKKIVVNDDLKYNQTVIANTRDGFFRVTLSCSSKPCTNGTVEARRFLPNNTVMNLFNSTLSSGDKVDLFRSVDDYVFDGFVNEHRDLYCTGVRSLKEIVNNTNLDHKLPITFKCINSY